MSCYCHFCGYQMRFHIARAGEAVNCFNCGMETVLFIPGLSAPYGDHEIVLEARELGWSKSQLGLRYLEGVVENKSAKHLDWVRIEFILYSQPELPVGSTSDSLVGLAPSNLWKFRAPVAQPEALHASEPLLSCEYGRVAVAKPKPLVNGVSRAPL